MTARLSCACPRPGADPWRGVAAGLVLAAVALVAPGCSDGVGIDDHPSDDETELPVAGGDGEAGSLGELRAQVEAEARDAGLTASQVACVLDYLDETFDDSASGEQADLAVDEAVAACAPDPLPDLPADEPAPAAP